MYFRIETGKVDIEKLESKIKDINEFISLYVNNERVYISNKIQRFENEFVFGRYDCNEPYYQLVNLKSNNLFDNFDQLITDFIEKTKDIDIIKLEIDDKK